MDALGRLRVAYKASYGFAGLSAFADPILDALAIELDGRRFLLGIVGPNNFHKTAIARPGLFGNHHAIKGMLLLANSGKPYR